MEHPSVARLTPQQLACLRLLPTCHTYKAVARALSLSPKTVEAHVGAARAALGGVDRYTAAAMVAARDAAEGLSPKGETPMAPTLAFPSSGAVVPAERLTDVASDFQRIAWTDARPDARSRQPHGAWPHVVAALQIVALICVIAIGVLAIVATSVPAAGTWSAVANLISPRT